MFNKINKRNNFEYINFMSLGFFLMPFAFYFQVKFMSPLAGIIPYLFFIFGFMEKLYYDDFLGLQLAKKFDSLDMLIIAFIFVNIVYIVIGCLLSWELMTGLKYFIQFVLVALLYFYLSISANDKEVKGALLFISLAFAIVTLHWLGETIYLRIIKIVPDFQLESFQYSKMRNTVYTGLAASIDNRAFGLVENHTGTGAFVVISGLALISFGNIIKTYISFLRYVLFLLFIVFIGGAKTSTVALVLVLFLVIFFPLRLSWQDFGKGVLPYFYLLLSLIALILLKEKVFNGIIYHFLLSLMKDMVHLADIFNATPSPGKVSWINIYYNEFLDLSDYFKNNLTVALFGEGIISVNTPGYKRGGEVALFEVISMFGIPFFIIFFGILFGKIFQTIRNIKNLAHYELIRKKESELLYGLMIICFMVITLLHYNTMFMKPIFVMFFFGLGLLRRYNYGKEFSN